MHQIAIQIVFKRCVCALSAVHMKAPRCTPHLPCSAREIIIKILRSENMCSAHGPNSIGLFCLIAQRELNEAKNSAPLANSSKPEQWHTGSNFKCWAHNYHPPPDTLPANFKENSIALVISIEIPQRHLCDWEANESNVNNNTDRNVKIVLAPDLGSCYSFSMLLPTLSWLERLLYWQCLFPTTTPCTCTSTVRNQKTFRRMHGKCLVARRAHTNSVGTSDAAYNAKYPCGSK